MEKTFNDDGTITIRMTEYEYFNSLFGNKREEQIPVNTPIFQLGDGDLETQVTNLLSQIGMPRNIKGFNYVRQAIVMAAKNPGIMERVTKELYPVIAKNNSTIASRAERAIRHAIEVTWGRGNIEIINSLFGYTISSNKDKATNSEFIALLADHIRLQIKQTGGDEFGGNMQ
jgi:two-component system response regulator (stage 0 sporulation protein A)